MTRSEKACPIVTRVCGPRLEVLAFVHPSAGKQPVKGTIEAAETPVEAATRELREESGIMLATPPPPLGCHEIGEPRRTWHFFTCRSSSLPETWKHATEDDDGHIFAFFWHPLAEPLDRSWHPDYHAAFGAFADRLQKM